MTTLHAFDYLNSNEPMDVSVCVVFGNEPLLKLLVAARLKSQLLGDESIPIAHFEGETCEWKDIHDELQTVSLFGSRGQRLVLIDDADSFVTRNRKNLETLAGRPKGEGTLVLVVGGWASNTNLYKEVHRHGLQIDCRKPTKGKATDQTAVIPWLRQRSEQAHQAKLEKLAAQLLIDVMGDNLGLLDQEIARLALYAGVGGKITAAMVREMGGGWRTKTAWDLVAAATDGQSAEAIRQLDRLLHAGENPIAILAQISWSLRRLASVIALYEEGLRSGRKMGIREYLKQAGYRNFQNELQDAEAHLRRLGRGRIRDLYRLLLQTDLELKSSHSSDARARTSLERLLLQIAQ